MLNIPKLQIKCRQKYFYGHGLNINQFVNTFLLYFCALSNTIDTKITRQICVLERSQSDAFQEEAFFIFILIFSEANAWLSLIEPSWARWVQMGPIGPSWVQLNSVEPQSRQVEPSWEQLSPNEPSWEILNQNQINSQNILRNYKTRSLKRLEERYKDLKVFLDWLF